MEQEERAKELYEEPAPDSPGFLSRVRNFTGKFIHWKTAIPSAAVMSGWAFASNLDHGLDEGLYAAARHFPMSLIFGGLVYKGAYKIAGAFKNALLSYGAATLFEAGVGMGFCTYHYLTGTPDYIQTSVLQPLMALPFIYITAHQARKEQREQF